MAMCAIAEAQGGQRSVASTAGVLQKVRSFFVLPRPKGIKPVVNSYPTGTGAVTSFGGSSDREIDGPLEAVDFS